MWLREVKKIRQNKVLEARKVTNKYIGYSDHNESKPIAYIITVTFALLFVEANLQQFKVLAVIVSYSMPKARLFDSDVSYL